MATTILLASHQVVRTWFPSQGLDLVGKSQLEELQCVLESKTVEEETRHYLSNLLFLHADPASKQIEWVKTGPLTGPLLLRFVSCTANIQKRVVKVRHPLSLPQQNGRVNNERP